MAFLFTRAFWRELRFTTLLLLLLGALGIQRSCEPEPTTRPGYQPVGDQRPTEQSAQLPAQVLHLVNYRRDVVPPGDTSTSAQPNLARKANPRSRWHSVAGPAYLVYPLPRRPKQAQLDIEAARAAQLHKI